MLSGCLNCGRLDGRRRLGRCDCCYVYRRQHGAERPLRVILRHYAQPCRGCRRPVAPTQRAYGYCPACAQAHRRAGVPMLKGA